MMKLGDKLSEFEERRMELYAELLSSNIAEMSVQRFEHIYRQIHTLTQRILSFKGGLNYDKSKE
ncbi:MAG: hypothetical protein J6I37_07045 [Prevotella sp.]|jgi:hypothetical protein|nr:hypothetical protein [Prevotella sp.]